MRSYYESSYHACTELGMLLKNTGSSVQNIYGLTTLNSIEEIAYG